MKYFIATFTMLFILLSFLPSGSAEGMTASAEPSVYDTFQKDEGSPSKADSSIKESESPSLFSLFIKFILSFALIIGLLIFLLKFLSKRNQSLQASGPILSLGGRMLGNNRSLQVVLIGQTIYIIGVGEDISLIRAIPKGEEYQHLLESYENQAESLTLKMKESNEKWNSILQKNIEKIKKMSGVE